MFPPVIGESLHSGINDYAVPSDSVYFALSQVRENWPALRDSADCGRAASGKEKSEKRVIAGLVDAHGQTQTAGARLDHDRDRFW